MYVLLYLVMSFFMYVFLDFVISVFRNSLSVCVMSLFSLVFMFVRYLFL